MQSEKPRVKLLGADGNVFSIIARVRRALSDAGDESKAKEFEDAAWSADSYDSVLQLCFRYVDVA